MHSRLTCLARTHIGVGVKALSVSAGNIFCLEPSPGLAIGLSVCTTLVHPSGIYSCELTQDELASTSLGSDNIFLHGRLRTATLRNDFEGQAVLLNCLLRNYLHYNLYYQAFKLVEKSAFPEVASNNEWARFLYYLGRINAIQLEYTKAHKNLLQAIRKAPQHTAIGFKQTVC
ncbi:probable 26S proteasome non-ATPase regulatory subunit 3 [Centruroides sculpturatus]|uniref:probable 26S proteasome non-ATPase regulatory subunit 3 n=1 Tax=Centruroides sculpturatus TaxID=218467 RepID=UPI000C6DE6BC|nr:probable 26S proteasome non-ATPase regulatory subunit 3 [Centruroides sculpturatus]